jgi:signal peptidase I
MLRSNGYGGPVDDRSVPGRRAAPRPTGPRPPRPPRSKGPKHYKERSFWRELPMLVVVALGLALLIKTFLVQAFYIPSGSMENTLEIDDRVLVNKLSYKIGDVQRGDVIVFNGNGSWDPEGGLPTVEPEPSDPISGALGKLGDLFAFTATNETDYIKRVIGVPGDRVQCCDAKGRVTVNGVPLNEGAYLHPGNAPSDEPFDRTVPEGRLWVMGDHRAASLDSRGHDNGAASAFGTIPVDHVIGRAFVIVWPLNRLAVLARPPSFADAALAMRTEDAGPLAGIALGAPLAGLQTLRTVRALRSPRRPDERIVEQTERRT